MSGEVRSQTGVPSRPYARITRFGRELASGWNRIGRQMQFYLQTIRSTGDALIYYKAELIRVIVELGQGTRALIRIGGTVMVVGMLMLAAGVVSAQTLWNALRGIGIEALAGFSVIIIVRVVVPLVTAVGLAGTIGAGATAQIGAMRINEEIDALEVIGVRTVAYLASTRLIAGMIVTIPLFGIATITVLGGVQIVVTLAGLSSGVYNHYFRTFLYPTDLLWSLLLLLIAAGAVMLIHTYYGYTASGGPAGVGEAVGRAVRASLVTAISLELVGTMAIYGANPSFEL